mmetsp:Transcript_28410/g.60879  ORF Transcript_28410/g.60879 Transcript_28410/m.60879 type:complete len:393 (-) Transcript_28410:2208-3386(-)
MSQSNNTLEVLYQGSATELFLAIEEMEWRDAFDIIESSADQVRTWVKSFRTENTTFNDWRRLPIHEACMRRAPAWLISELLSAFPESSSLTTNLGEYPLHLAVDKGCAPEVVNLIIVANWNAIVLQDLAGRTPLDIIDRTELLEFENNKIIFESLKQCRKTYVEIHQAFRDEKSALLRKQKAKSNAVAKKHQNELQLEFDKQAKMKEEIGNLKVEINNMGEVRKEKDLEIQKLVKAKNGWMEKIRQLEADKADQQQQLETERSRIKALLFKIEQKNEEIQRKDKKIDVLSKDLSSIVISNETDVLDSLIATEQSMRTMVSNQIALQKLISSKSTGLKTLLKQRGIAVPDEDGLHQPEEPQEEKTMQDDDAIYRDTASAAMMAAAMAALSPKT